jgi:hypothetical protein
MVKESGAKSTDMEAPEDVDKLCAKTVDVAKAWSSVADRLWAERQEKLEKEQQKQNTTYGVAN